MSKTLFILIVSSFLFLPSCDKSNLSVKAPLCIEDMIKTIQAEDVQNPPAQVWRWQVDGQTYFYITSNCCDQFNYLFDSQCIMVCAPDGGITGAGDGNCPDLNSQIEKILVWEDNS